MIQFNGKGKSRSVRPSAVIKAILVIQCLKKLDHFLHILGRKNKRDKITIGEKGQILSIRFRESVEKEREPD